MKREFYAHIRMDGDIPIYQTLQEHSEKTAKYAADALRPVGLSATAKLAGKIHDTGKARDVFQNYLYDAIVEGKPVKRGSINHSSAGCRFFLEQYHEGKELDMSAVTAELLAYACGAHHGLFDCLNEKSGFQHRIIDDTIEYDAVKKGFMEPFTAEYAALFAESVNEVSSIVDKVIKMCENRPEGEAEFYIGMLERLLLSAVMEGDRRDTAEFMNNRQYPSFHSDNERVDMWRKTKEYMEQKLALMDCDGSINQARRRISEQCAAFAEKHGGIIRLNVPTGAGKTLASLRYALRHAERYNKTRIIFTSSLLSVLDQNAKVIRSFLPEQDLVLEHHSNVLQSDLESEREEWQMMTEAWRAPIILTTLVQLLNTMFLGKTSSIRRFHALCNAVLIIDEAQTITNELLTLFNLTLNFLSEICGTTIVLCSATQPCLEKAEHPLLYTPREMVPYDEATWAAFRRTRLCVLKPQKLEDIPGFAEQILHNKQSLLIVCNMKQEAKELFRLCTHLNASVFHLSAGMCMQHRCDTLNSMQSALARKEKVLCISTQVIEAGVDISFECVVRFLAGMDSIVQAAGRCNRHGESLTPADVYIVECIGEKLGKLKTIKDGQSATISLLETFAKEPERIDGSLISDKAINHYFKKLYAQMDKEFQDGPISELRTSLYNLLSTNIEGTQTHNPAAEKYVMHQCFKTAGEHFAVFDTDTVAVVVGYEGGCGFRSALIAQSESYSPDYREIERLLQQVKPFMVSLYHYQVEKLEKCGALQYLFDGRIAVLSDGFYEKHTGFTLDTNFWEV